MNLSRILWPWSHISKYKFLHCEFVLWGSTPVGEEMWGRGGLGLQSQIYWDPPSPLPSPPPFFWILDLEKHSTMGSQLYPPIYCTVYSKATSVPYSTVTQCRLSSSDSWVLAAVQWSSTDSVEEPVHWSGTDSRRTSPLIRYIPSRLLKSPSQDPVHTAQCTV